MLHKLFTISPTTKIFLHILFGLLLGSIAAMMYLCSSKSFRQYAARTVEKQFQKDYNCQLHCHVERIDWWSLKMIFSNVSIAPCNQSISDQNQEHLQDGKEWSMIADKLTISAAWWHLLTHRCLKLDLKLEHLIMFETFEQTPAGLIQFCAKLLSPGTSTFILYDALSIHDGLLYLKKKNDNVNIQIPYICNIQQERYSTKLQTYIHDGYIQRNDTVLVRNISGSCICDMPSTSFLQNLNGQLQLNYIAVPLTHSNVSNTQQSNREGAGFIAGKMENGIGEFVLKSEDGSIAIDPIKIQCLSSECLCKIGLCASSQLIKYFDLPDFLQELNGKAGIEINVDLYNLFKTFSLSMLLDDITYKSQSIFPGVKILITNHNRNGFTGAIHIADKVLFDIHALLNEHDKKHTDTKSIENYPDQGFTIHANNASDLTIAHSDWIIEKNKYNLKVIYTNQDSIAGHYDIELYHTKLDDHKYISGSFSIKNEKLFIQGIIEDIAYEGIIQIFPNIVFENLHGTKNNKVVFDFSNDKNNPTNILGTIDFSLLHDLVPEPFKISFAQEGSLALSGYIKDKVIYTNVKIAQACMRIPNMYNIIQDATASCEINFHEKKIIFKDVDISWYEGKTSCTQASIFIDPTGKCSFVHIPLLFHDLMFSWDKGIYSRLSGRLLISKENLEKLFHVEGILMLQKSELKENLFSCEFQEILSEGLLEKIQHNDKAQDTNNFNCTYDISIFTKDPLYIKTSFLSAQAIVNLVVKGCILKPELSGTIQLISGSLFFPYKPLEITDGKLIFIPEQPFDPIVELVAKGKLKRFGVSMRAWGSALDPHVQFESQPYLSEEQIVSLLLLGVENNSLGVMIPAFLMQKLNEIIFGPALSKIKLKATFDRLLKSLRHFRFLPQFTNQTGRGGMRGTFEIDASENLHGKIDTNFMQIEDTKFDIDYTITDDVTLRLQKDGPSTYGGEVEFRWKFS